MISRRFTLPPSALLLLLTLATAPAAAQTKAPPAVPAAPAPAAPPAATSQTDLMPLKKALAPLVGNGLLEMQSSLQLTGSRGGATFLFRGNVHVLARRPDSFRAEMSPIGADGIPKPKVLVVSNGKRVWTYSPGQRVYSVMTRSAFEDTDDIVLLPGPMLRTFFLNKGHDLTVVLGSIHKAEDSKAVLQALAGGGLILTAKTQSVDGRDYLVYQMVFQKQAVSCLFYVDPQTSVLKRFDLTGKAKGIQIAFQETLTTLRVPASVPADTFAWTPPPGAKKSSKVKVAPF